MDENMTLPTTQAEKPSEEREDKRFVVGARVAVNGRFGDWYEDAVAKVYKNGNFTLLKTAPQQYRPYRHRFDNVLAASQTGDAWNGVQAYLWDEDSEPMIKDGVAKWKHKKRAQNVSHRLYKLSASDCSGDTLSKFEAALDAADADREAAKAKR